MGNVEQKLTALHWVLPEVPKQELPFQRVCRDGSTLYVSGHASRRHGRLGSDLSVEEGREAAQEACLRCLASIKAEIGDLGNVERVVKVLGFVNSTPGFAQQTEVMNGCSELLVSLYGERGMHARSAVGVCSLPGNAAVEIEMVVKLKQGT